VHVHHFTTKGSQHNMHSSTRNKEYGNMPPLVCHQSTKTSSKYVQGARSMEERVKLVMYHRQPHGKLCKWYANSSKKGGCPHQYLNVFMCALNFVHVFFSCWETKKITQYMSYPFFTSILSRINMISCYSFIFCVTSWICTQYNSNLLGTNLREILWIPTDTHLSRTSIHFRLDLFWHKGGFLTSNY